MRTLSIFLVALCCCTQMLAQDSVVTKKRAYKVTISLNNQQADANGYLALFSDSSMYLSKKEVTFKGYIGASTFDYQPMSYEYIELVKLKRVGAAGRAAIYGAVTGAVIGVAIGLISGTDPPCTSDFLGFCELTRTTAGEKAAIAGVGLGGTGALVGLLIGTLAHKTFVIHGSKANFNNMKTALVR